jgi:hypothetical protein
VRHWDPHSLGALGVSTTRPPFITIPSGGMYTLQKGLGRGAIREKPNLPQFNHLEIERKPLISVRFR